ncbi:hypothetical protein F5Y03DRAFT_385617 [Xylaria venustula]|nr:hypothetical protein F5Y03DRAFT_385617 [Xylaria venustula]
MSTSFNSTGDAPTQRVPAWKRLGLKLKPASEAQSNDATHHHSTPTPPSSSVPNSRAHIGGSTPNAKRRASAGAPALDHSAKRARQDTTTSSHQTPNKRPKAVTFAAETAGPQASVPVKSKQPKQKAGVVNAAAAAVAAPAKPIKKSAPVNLEPALAYLRSWHTERATGGWKFNKNHQTKLLEQVFAGADETTIPAVDINVFYEYIRGLQGGVRTRLRELANGVKTQDMEAGAASFAPGKITEMAERKQKEYEEVIRAFLGQARTPEKKRRFDEVEYVLRTTDMEMQRRVVKRMRAEMVLDELSETDASEVTTTSTTTTTTTTSGESTSTEKGNPPGRDDGQGSDKRLQLNDGPQQRTKRKRKLRTAAVEDDTSSESESESESDADTSSSGSSSSSDSDSDSDSGEGTPGSGANQDTSSSSSSSSSSSESESDSEDDD